jgi:tetratricopeptide (TPR) repeat protein
MSVKDSTQSGTKNSMAVEKIKFSERLNDFLIKNRKGFGVFGIAVAIIVVGIGTATVVSRNISIQSTQAMEKLEADFDAWNTLKDDKKAAEGLVLISVADTLISRYPKRYAAAAASIIKAQVLTTNGDLEGAEKVYADLVAKQPDSHIAPVALANAASLAEDRGSVEKALEYLKRASEQYPTAPGSGRVLLSLGRIYEQNKQFDKAKEAYGKLIASGNESDWTKLARDRIIIMKSLGLAE